MGHKEYMPWASILELPSGGGPGGPSRLEIQFPKVSGKMTDESFSEKKRIV